MREIIRKSKKKKGLITLHAIQPEQRYLIHLISSVLHDLDPQSPQENIDWEKLYNIAAWNSIANMACYGINRLSTNQKPSQEVMIKFQNQCKKAVMKEATQHITVEHILEVFEKNSIDCMPLKGYLIKYLYPKPDMRLMADVDILVKDEQTKKVKDLMLDLGFTAESHGGNHDVYYKKPYMNIEIHRRLVSEDSPYSEYLSKTWDRAILKPGHKFIWQLSIEDLYIYLMIHLTKHYISGGTGIRSFMDIWVYNNRYQNEMNWGYIQAELDKIKLREFTEKICGLNDIWFGGEKENDTYKEMTEYIFSNGTYGTQKHSIISTMNTLKADNSALAKYAYWLRLFFPPLKKLCTVYPILDRLPFLLPFCWILRGAKNLFFKRRHMLGVIKDVNAVSKEEIDELRKLYQKTGLR